MPKLTLNSSSSHFILCFIIRFLMKSLLTVYNKAELFCAGFSQSRILLCWFYTFYCHTVSVFIFSLQCIATYIFYYLTKFAAICWPSAYEIVCIRTYLGKTTWGAIGNKFKMYSLHKRCGRGIQGKSSHSEDNMVLNTFSYFKRYIGFFNNCILLICLLHW